MIDKREIDRETANFIAHMKKLFSKIPGGLSAREYQARAERAKAIADSLDRQHDKKMEQKKYQLLAQKYQQLADYATGRKKPAVRDAVQVQPVQEKLEVIQERKSRFDYFFLLVALFGFVLSGLFFSSLMMQSISGLSRVWSNIIGVILGIAGLIFFYFGLINEGD